MRMQVEIDTNSIQNLPVSQDGDTENVRPKPNSQKRNLEICCGAGQAAVSQNCAQTRHCCAMPQTLLAKQQMCKLRLCEIILQVHSQKLPMQAATCSLAATALLLLEVANCKKLRCKASLDHVGDNKLQAAQLPLHPQH